MSLEPVAARELPALPEPALARPTALFCNQFLLGPRCPDELADWPDLAVAGNFRLVAHPELPVTRVVRGQRALTLIGFMLDPDDPVADDRSILARLLDDSDGVERIVQATASLGGRWLLIAESEQDAHLFTDALGLRQALYTQPDMTGELWVMSQAGLGADLLGLRMDERAAGFLDSYVVRAQRPEYYWPGTTTPLAGVRRLLPNHVLDLRTGKAERYWPAAPLPLFGMDSAVDRASLLMTGLLCAAATRFDLVLSVTAGIDSRVLLAAARPIKDQVSYITVRQAQMSDDNADLQVPARLLHRLGLPHEIVRAPGSASARFSWAFKRNVFLAHDHYMPDAEALMNRFGRRKAAATGSGAEVARCASRQLLPLADRRGVTARELAWAEGMPHPYAEDAFREWLAGARDCTHVKLLDLFEWEQGQGSWLAMTQLEFDICWRDIVTPYNCRELLVTMLGVRQCHRRSPRYTLFTEIARRVWPEVLSESINPHKQLGRVRALAHALKYRLQTMVTSR